MRVFLWVRFRDVLYHFGFFLQNIDYVLFQRNLYLKGTYRDVATSSLRFASNHKNDDFVCVTVPHSKRCMSRCHSSPHNNDTQSIPTAWVRPPGPASVNSIHSGRLIARSNNLPFGVFSTEKRAQRQRPLQESWDRGFPGEDDPRPPRCCDCHSPGPAAVPHPQGALRPSQATTRQTHAYMTVDIGGNKWSWVQCLI